MAALDKIFTVTLNYKNGGKEILFSKVEPNIDQLRHLRIFLESGGVVWVNLDEVRKFEVVAKNG